MKCILLSLLLLPSLAFASLPSLQQCHDLVTNQRYFTVEQAKVAKDCMDANQWVMDPATENDMAPIYRQSIEDFISQTEEQNKVLASYEAYQKQRDAEKGWVDDAEAAKHPMCCKLGWTWAQVKRSRVRNRILNNPDDVNTTIVAGRKYQQLIYRDIGLYLYLSNGILTAIQH